MIENNKSSYMVQLDALRAIAVFGVLVHHYLPQDFILNKLQWGHLGVRLFFVLSGFLVTGILLKYRSLIQQRQHNPWFTLRNFYVRRFLRLIPVYYLVILLTVIFASKINKFSLLWHLTYTSNLYFSFYNWDAVASHFWTLAVEAQFYLIWPLIILFLPYKYLRNIFFIIILISPFFRFLLIKSGLDNGRAEYILTFSCIDSLGIGSLLAYYQLNRFKNQVDYNFFKFIFWLNLPIFIFLYSLGITNINIRHDINLTFSFLSASVFFVYIINFLSKGVDSWIGKILEVRLLVYLGKISYGIYIYHLLTPQIISVLLSKINISIPDSDCLKFFLFTVSTVVISIFSWHIFEQPINALKVYFPYKK